MDPVWLALPGFLIWSAVIAAPWRPWSTRESLDAAGPAADADLVSVTVLIPARNERQNIARTLKSLSEQGRNLKTIVIDDQSMDGTSAAARESGLDLLTIIVGQTPAAGWTGKLWALEQGRRAATTPYLLLLDADIELLPGTLPALLNRLEAGRLGLVSLMAKLRMEGFWEKLLMPAFVYFFKLLYPFRLANSDFRHLAAAAGGCILIRASVLEQMGGFAALRGELIDDCALAKKVKEMQHRTWVGLTQSAYSARRYPRLRDIWDMVARTAFTQLRYSVGLLLLCSALLIASFVLPVLSLFQDEARSAALGSISLLLMCASYLPILRYYHLGAGWSALLPAIGVLFLLMTWTSALRHWFGPGANWKGRHYPRAGKA